MKKVTVKFNTQIKNTRKLVQALVADRLNGNEVDEDGDHVAPITTAIALMQSAMVLVVTDLETKEVPKDDIIENALNLAADIARITFEHMLGVKLDLTHGHAGNSGYTKEILAEAKKIVADRKQQQEMDFMEEGIKGDPNNVVDMIANIQKRTKH